MEKFLVPGLFALIIVGALAYFDLHQRSPKQEQLEYKVVSVLELLGPEAPMKLNLMMLSPELQEATEKSLGELSLEGWELVCMADGLFYFKREARPEQYVTNSNPSAGVR